MDLSRLQSGFMQQLELLCLSSWWVRSIGTGADRIKDNINSSTNHDEVTLSKLPLRYESFFESKENQRKPFVQWEMTCDT